MQIVERRVSELIPYENNPRNNDGAVEAVAASIREFGFKVPVIVDKDDVIIAGHTRVKAAELLGLEYIPTIQADDLTDEQVKAFRLADNKVGELASWDMAKLDAELAEIKNLDMDAFGFDAEIPAAEELDAKEVKAENPITVKITFVKNRICKKLSRI